MDKDIFETTVEISANTKKELLKILEQIRTILVEDETCASFYVNDIESFHT